MGTSLIRSAGRKIFIASGFLWFLWLIGWIVRDRNWLGGILFYIPSPCLGLLFVILAVHFWRKKRYRHVGICILFAVPPGAACLFVENQWTRPSHKMPEGSLIRLVHWNVCRGKLGWIGAQERLERWDADMYVLSEIPKEKRFFSQRCG